MSASSPTVRRRRLGLILRDLRKATGLSCLDVGQRIERSDSWVSRLENGRTGLRVRDLQELLDVYQVADVQTRAELEQLAREAKQRGWWNRYGQTVTGPYASFISFEHEASKLLCYDALAVNGLLQTEGYARALHRHAVSTKSSSQEDLHITTKLTRQRRLTGDNPPELWVVLDEATLRRRFGGSEVMRDQLAHLLTTVQDLPHVSIQVLPFDQVIFPGMLASFTLMDFPPPDGSIVFSEGLTGAIHEETEDSARYRIIFDELRASALSKADSVELISQRMRKLML
nr:helix-turn-helix transcriptional regulator [Micromonospora sp. DSM 115978]